jgi:hypothetical protein
MIWRKVLYKFGIYMQFHYFCAVECQNSKNGVVEAHASLEDK